MVVKGMALVARGEECKFVRKNESFYISATECHRLDDPGRVPLEIIEIQHNSYLDEVDIIRS